MIRLNTAYLKDNFLLVLKGSRIQYVKFRNGHSFLNNLPVDFQKSNSISVSSISKDVEMLFRKTYKQIPYNLNELNEESLIFVLYSKSWQLIGSLAIFYNHYSKISYNEIGLMIISREFRNKRLQRNLAIPVLEKAYRSILSGIPIYSSVRVQNAKSQHLIYNFTNPFGNSQLSPCGFLPYYILDTDENDFFYLESGLLYEGWDEFRLKNILLPKSLKEFRVCNRKYNPRIRPKFIKTNHLNQRPTRKCTLFSLEYHDQPLLSSKHDRFKYFDSNNQTNRVIHIMDINTLDFLEDLKYEINLRSINIALRCTYVPLEKPNVKNILIMDKLVNFGFIPTAVFDVLENGKRESVIQFCKWQDINFQEKIEVLNEYKPLLRGFLHDIYLQKDMLSFLDELFIIRME